MEMNIKDFNDMENVELWGVRGLRIMIENLSARIAVVKEFAKDDIDVAVNDILIKAKEVEKAIKRVIKTQLAQRRQ